MAQSGYTPISIYYSATATNVPLAANLTSGELGINIADGKLYYKDNAGTVQVLASKAGNINVSSISFGTTGLTPSTTTTGAVTVAGTLVVSNGGTGQTTLATGSIGYGQGTSAHAALAIGTAGQVLTVNSGATAPQWVNASSIIGGAGGSNTQVQYNSSGALAGSANLTFNGTTLTTANDASISGLTVGKGGGTYATILGASALANGFGGNNTAIGANAANALTSGNSNTVVGSYAMATGVVTGTDNIALGSQHSGVTAGPLNSLTSGSYNVAVGNGSLQANTTASNNTAVGFQSGYANTTGNYLTAFGYTALAANTTGTLNSAFGADALLSNTTGGSNSASGTSALQNNTTGSYNTAQGYASLASNTTASNNTAVGFQAGYSNTTGTRNVSLGVGAGYATTTGSYNICIGSYAGQQITTGLVNTLIGDGAGNLITTGGKNSIIGGYSGNQGSLDIRTASNYIVLSDGDGNPRLWCDNNGDWSTRYTSTVYMPGNGDAGTGGLILQNGSNNTSYKIIKFRGWNNSETGSITTYVNVTAYTTSSDARLKEDLGLATETSVIDNLKIRNFEWKSTGKKDIGVFAQEAEPIKPSAVVKGTDELTESGDLAVPWSVDYSKYVPDLIVYCQQLNAKLEAQALEIATLKGK